MVFVPLCAESSCMCFCLVWVCWWSSACINYWSHARYTEITSLVMMFCAMQTNKDCVQLDSCLLLHCFMTSLCFKLSSVCVCRGGDQVKLRWEPPTTMMLIWVGSHRRRSTRSVSFSQSAFSIHTFYNHLILSLLMFLWYQNINEGLSVSVSLSNISPIFCLRPITALIQFDFCWFTHSFALSLFPSFSLLSLVASRRGESLIPVSCVSLSIRLALSENG